MQIVDVQKQNLEIESKNSMWIIIGILAIILVSGIVIIRIIKKK